MPGAPRLFRELPQILRIAFFSPPTAFCSLPSASSALPSGVQLGVAYHLADGLLDGALGLRGGTLDPFLVDVVVSLVLVGALLMAPDDRGRAPRLVGRPLRAFASGASWRDPFHVLEEKCNDSWCSNFALSALIG